jgi:hypothetical protein
VPGDLVGPVRDIRSTIEAFDKGVTPIEPVTVIAASDPIEQMDPGTNGCCSRWLVLGAKVTLPPIGSPMRYSQDIGGTFKSFCRLLHTLAGNYYSC